MSIDLDVGSGVTLPLSSLTDLANAAPSALSLGPEFAGQLDQPLSKLPPNLASTSIQYTSGNQSWNLGGFTFSLSGGVTGKLSVILSGTLFTYTDGFPTDVTIGLNPVTNPNYIKTISVPNGAAYVCIELDFQIQGGISGSFTQGIYGVSGSVNTNDMFTIAFYKECDPSISLKAAIAASFSDFVFPLHPQTLTNLKVGDYLHHNFNANLQLGLGASIGYDKVFYAGQYKADIPGTANAVGINTSVKLEVQAGAKLAFSFDYAGTFESLIWKDRPAQGHLHLYRSKTQDLNLGLNLGLTLSSNPGASVTAMTQQLGDTLDGFLPGPLGSVLTNAVLPKAAPEIDKYVTEVNSKIADWLKPVSQGTATLDVAIQKTNSTYLLTDYAIDLTVPAWVNAWDMMIHGKFRDAIQTPGNGVSLAVGSGFEKFYSKKTTLSLNLFGKLNATWSSAVVSSSSIVYAGNNVFHVIANEGRQILASINNNKREIDIYFAAQADLKTAALTLSPVELHIVLQATNNTQYGQYIAGFLGLINVGQTNAVLVKSIDALAAKPNTIQLLHITLSAAAFGQLTFSTLADGHPYDETNDQKNYAAFERSCSELDLGSPANFSFEGKPLDYPIWRDWIIASNDQWPPPSSAVPDRTHSAGSTGGVAALDSRFPDAGLSAAAVGYTLEAATDFMNLCESLKELSALPSAQPDLSSWNLLLNDLKRIIRNDVCPDFVAPVALALTRLCAGSLPGTVQGPVPGLTDQTSIAVALNY
jgi:hypothetical protein